MDLVIELLSKSTRGYDLGEKRAAYREGGVPEVWLIDSESQEFHVDCLEAAKGQSYRTELLKSGRWPSRVLPGLWVEASWFWSEPLPNPLKCLQAILGETP
jgi:Uma2 family endonuclease